LMAFKVISHSCYLPFVKHASCEVTNSFMHEYFVRIVAYCCPQCVMWHKYFWSSPLNRSDGSTLRRDCLDVCCVICNNSVLSGLIV
jgi:hypothetical protein